MGLQSERATRSKKDGTKQRTSTRTIFFYYILVVVDTSSCTKPEKGATHVTSTRWALDSPLDSSAFEAPHPTAPRHKQGEHRRSSNARNTDKRQPRRESTKPREGKEKSETNERGSLAIEGSLSQDPVTKVVRIFFWGSSAQNTLLPYHNARHCRSYPPLGGCRSASTPPTKLPRDILQPVSPCEQAAAFILKTANLPSIQCPLLVPSFRGRGRNFHRKLTEPGKEKTVPTLAAKKNISSRD